VSRATRADVERAIELREALRELLLGHHGDYETDPRAAGVVEDTARRARLEVRFDADGVAHVAPAGSGVDAALGRLLSIVADAQADGTWSRLKACPWETCRWAFYDHSKNRSGVWCNMAVCGNRAKARAYRERRQRRPA
jgi:predicted RNA-binding Zn ribbon-like protein